MLMVLAKGFANAGTVNEMAASKAILRKNTLVFMRVKLPFGEDRVSRTASCRWLDGVDTRAAGE
jgi:hypothetical protein